MISMFTTAEVNLIHRNQQQNGASIVNLQLGLIAMLDTWLDNTQCIYLSNNLLVMLHL